MGKAPASRRRSLAKESSAEEAPATMRPRSASRATISARRRRRVARLAEGLPAALSDSTRLRRPLAVAAAASTPGPSPWFPRRIGQSGRKAARRARSTSRGMTTRSTTGSFPGGASAGPLRHSDVAAMTQASSGWKSWRESKAGPSMMGEGARLPGRS